MERSLSIGASIARSYRGSEHALIDDRGRRGSGGLLTLPRSIEIRNEAVARHTESGEAGFSAAAIGLVFEMADPEDAAREPR
jgi:hypothetical protein